MDGTGSRPAAGTDSQVRGGSDRCRRPGRVTDRHDVPDRRTPRAGSARTNRCGASSAKHEPAEHPARRRAIPDPQHERRARRRTRDRRRGIRRGWPAGVPLRTWRSSDRLAHERAVDVAGREQRRSRRSPSARAGDGQPDEGQHDPVRHAAVVGDEGRPDQRADRVDGEVARLVLSRRRARRRARGRGGVTYPGARGRTPSRSPARERPGHAGGPRRRPQGLRGAACGTAGAARGAAPT